jgi:hypothetical protein
MKGCERVCEGVRGCETTLQFTIHVSSVYSVCGANICTRIQYSGTHYSVHFKYDTRVHGILSYDIYDLILYTKI